MTSKQHKLLAALFVLFLTSVLASCLDDESFTKDANAKLSFSSDTLSFDTLFSEVPSATKRFLVYNNNGNGIRISNAKLVSSGNSGFRMNVNGVSGVSINDIEILGKDSIFIFVEVTTPKQKEDTPTLVSDAIVFTLENGNQQKVLLEAYGQNVQVIKSLTINNDTTISSTIPCVVYNSLVVGKDATLTIAAGTTLCFHKDTGIDVYGALNIEGTLDKPVTLRGDRTDKMFWYLPYDRLNSQWKGIDLQPSCKGCNINYADIHSGVVGVSCDNIKGKLNITNSIIHNFNKDCLFIKESDALVANTQITNSGKNCVSVYGGATNFYHCTIAQFDSYSSERGHAVLVSNSFDDNPTIVQSSYFYNCFITGYASDEIYGIPGDEVLNLKFYSCALLTDISDDKYFFDCTEDKKDNERFKETNFKIVNNKHYNYDFHLDSLSVAISKASSSYSIKYPLDRDGIERGANPDAGCYQYK